jgi:hypothetical protein
MRPVDDRIRAKHEWRGAQSVASMAGLLVSAALVGIGSLSIKPTEAERAEISDPRDPERRLPR